MPPLRSFLQILCDGGELFEGGFEVGDDFGGEDVGVGEVGRVFEGIVLEPEDVEVGFVAFDQVVVGERFEAVRFFTVVPSAGRTCLVFGTFRFAEVAGDEVVEVGALDGVFFEGEMFVGTEVVNPEFFGPGAFVRSRFAIEEEDVGFDPLRVKDAGGKSQEGVDVGLFQQFAADGFAGAAFEEDVVGEDDGGASVHLEDGMDVLEKVELFVARAGPKVVAVDDQAFFGLFAVRADNRDAALFAKRRIGQDHVVFAMFRGQGVLGHNRQIRTFQRHVPGLGTNPMQQQIHGAEAGNAVHEFDAVKGAVAELAFLRFVELMVFDQVIVGGEEETAGAAGGIANGLSGLGSHDFDHGGDEGTRGEILAGAAFHVFGVLLQEPFVGVALHVGAQAGPLLLVDKIYDQAPQLGRVLDFILGFAKDRSEHAGTFAQFFEGMAVVNFEIVAIQLDQRFPTESFRNGTWLVERRLRLLIRHFQEQQIGQLLHVVAIRQAIIPEDVAVVPKFLNELLGMRHYASAAVRLWSMKTTSR